MDEQEGAGNPVPDENANAGEPRPDMSGPGASGPFPDTDGGRSRPDVSRMVAQLQQMIDQVATAATPAFREVAALAAELAAKAGEAAGPISQKAAQVTTQVGERVAARSSRFASDLRSQRNPAPPDQAPDAGEAPTPEQAQDAPQGHEAE